MKIDEQHTLYAITVKLSEDIDELPIGKLGRFTFRKGLYVYVGSAKRHIKKRIERHLKIDKKQHWHFDYLRPHVEIIDVKTFSNEEGECGLFHKLKEEYNGKIVVKKFGSSDCQCMSHLFYVKHSKEAD